MLEVLAYLLLGASILGFGMGLGGIIEFRRMRMYVYEYENLKAQLYALEEDVDAVVQAIQTVIDEQKFFKEELERTVITQEIPKFQDTRWPHDGAECVSYEPFEYED